MWKEVPIKVIVVLALSVSCLLQPTVISVF